MTNSRFGLLDNEIAEIFDVEIKVSNSNPYSAVQHAAINLYKLGFNVLPVCPPKLVASLSKLFPEKYSPSDKLPYILKPLLHSRMHYCGPLCSERESRTGNRCRGSQSDIDFLHLFENANIGSILGKTSGNLVCLDCDTSVAFKEAIYGFQSRGLGYWAYETSRGGNILFRLAEGESKNYTKCTIPNAQIWGNNRFCVLPPSIHSSGAVYTWLEDANPIKQLLGTQSPILSIQQVDWLGIQLNDNRAPKSDLFGLPEWTRYLSEKNRRILASEIEEGERNTMLTKATYDVAACIDQGLVDYPDAEKLLFWTASRCLPPYPKCKITSMLRSALIKENRQLSKEYYSNNVSSPSKDLIQTATQFLADHDWRTHGRTAQTDRAVFGACICRARFDRDVSFRASSREIADLANLQQHKTALVALNRLREKGILRLVGKDDCHANRYTFGDVVLIPNHPTINQLKNSGVLGNDQERIEFLPRSPAEQDVFLRLGKVSWIVWKHLVSNPEPKQCDICRKTNLNQPAVSKALVTLQLHGLVNYSQAEGLYVGECFAEDEFNNLALALDVFGKSDCRREKFSLDREIYTNWKIASAKQKILWTVNQHKEC